MRIVGLSYLDRYARLFFSSLAEDVGLQVVVVVTPPDPPSPAPRAAERWGRFLRSPRRVVRRQVDRLLRRAFARFFRPVGEGTSVPHQPEPPAAFQTLPVSADRLHHPSTLEAIRALDPDLLVTNGAPLLKASLFRLPRFGALNIHYGIAPAYRGENTLFWAMYRKDPEGIGVTIHRIDEGIDTGEVLARVYPDLLPDDDEEGLLLRLSRDAALALGGIIRGSGGQLPVGSPQIARGRLYPREARAVWHDLAYLARRRWLGEALPPRKGWVDAPARGRLQA